MNKIQNILYNLLNIAINQDKLIPREIITLYYQALTFKKIKNYQTQKLKLAIIKPE